MTGQWSGQKGRRTKKKERAKYIERKTEREREWSILSVKHRDLALHAPRWLCPGYNICRTWWATIYGSKDHLRLSSSVSSSSIMSAQDQHKWLFSKENQKMKKTSVKEKNAGKICRAKRRGAMQTQLNSFVPSGCLWRLFIQPISLMLTPRKLSVGPGQAKTRLKMLSSCRPFCSCILIFFFDIFLYPALVPAVRLLTAKLHLIFIGLIVFLQARKLPSLVKHKLFIYYLFNNNDIKIRFESKVYLFDIVYVWSKYFIIRDFTLCPSKNHSIFNMNIDLSILWSKDSFGRKLESHNLKNI